MNTNTRLNDRDRLLRQTYHKADKLLSGLTHDEISNCPVIASAWLKKKKDLELVYEAKFLSVDTRMDMKSAWLILFGQKAIIDMKKVFPWINNSKLHIIIAAFVLSRYGKVRFTAYELAKYLIPWQHTRLYKHLRELVAEGQIRREGEALKFGEPSLYSISEKGISTIEFYKDLIADSKETFITDIEAYKQRIRELWDNSSMRL